MSGLTGTYLSTIIEVASAQHFTPDICRPSANKWCQVCGRSSEIRGKIIELCLIGSSNVDFFH